MNLWKEKVADNLSRLLASSRTPWSPTNAIDPAVQHEQPQVQSISAEEKPSRDTFSFSSFLFSFFRKSRSAVGKDKSERGGSRQGLNLQPLRSLTARWRSSSSKDQSVQLCTDPTARNDNQDKEMHKGNREIILNDFVRVSAPEAHYSKDCFSAIVDESTFLTWSLYEVLCSSLPNIVKGCQWILLYSTRKHGISMRTLIRKSADLRGPCLLIAGDMQGAIFGGLLDCPLNETSKRKYQGTHQTFLFTTIHGEPRIFRATGANRYYFLCLNDQLAFGGGDRFALCLEEDLLHGTSGPSETFGNLCLAHSPEFELKNVELWGFTHVSKYKK